MTGQAPRQKDAGIACSGDRARMRDRALLADAVIKSAAKGAMDAGFGAKWFAAEMGLAHETLLHKLQPNGDRNLHTRELWESLHLAGPEAARPVLEAIAQEFAGVFVPLPAPSPNPSAGAESLQHLLLVAAAEFGKVVQAFLEASDPRGPGGSRFTRAEWERCWLRLQQALPVFFQIRTALSSLAGQEEG